MIKTKRLILREWKLTDAKDLARNLNNPKIAKKFSEVPYPYTLKHAKNYIKSCLKDYKNKKRTRISFAIEYNRKAVGGISLKNINPRYKGAEVGLWVGEAYWGKGLMTEALRLWIKYAFDKLKLVKIYGATRVDNKASIRLFEKNKLRRVGRLEKHFEKDGRWYDAYFYEKVN